MIINPGSDSLRELLRILIRNLGILEKSETSCSGVTISQCHAIVEIGRHEKISLIDLANILGLEKSTMSRTINNLVEIELVRRDIDLDNRRYLSIQLTDKGTEVFRSIEESMSEYYANIYNTIPDDKKQQVLESLEILVNSIKDHS